MTIQGYQFDKCKVTPEADAALYYQLNNKQNHVIAGYKNEMNVTSSGLNVYVDTGCALVMGRYCEITNQEQLSVMANTEGYVCITIDLTETNTAEGVPGSADYVVTNNQLRVELVTELVQQDLFNDGQVYTFPLAKVVANGTGMTISKMSESYSYYPNFPNGLKSKGVNVRNDTENESIFLKANLQKTGGYNDLIETGFYTIIDGAPGGTSTDTYGCILVLKRSDTSVTQMFIGAVTNQLWIRNRNGGTWTSWSQK